MREREREREKYMREAVASLYQSFSEILQDLTLIAYKSWWAKKRVLEPVFLFLDDVLRF